jgi:hypothetical protein
MAAVSSTVGENQSNGQVPAWGIDLARFSLYGHTSRGIKAERTEVDSASSRSLWMGVEGHGGTRMKARLFRIAFAVAMIAMFVEGLGARAKW